MEKCNINEVIIFVQFYFTVLQTWRALGPVLSQALIDPFLFAVSVMNNWTQPKVACVTTFADFRAWTTYV